MFPLLKHLLLWSGSMLAISGVSTVAQGATPEPIGQVELFLPAQPLRVPARSDVVIRVTNHSTQPLRVVLPVFTDSQYRDRLTEPSTAPATRPAGKPLAAGEHPVLGMQIELLSAYPYRPAYSSTGRESYLILPAGGSQLLPVTLAGVTPGPALIRVSAVANDGSDLSTPWVSIVVIETPQWKELIKEWTDFEGKQKGGAKP